jgi:transcriptional regulator with XRE-family HTH domain
MSEDPEMTNPARGQRRATRQQHLGRARAGDIAHRLGRALRDQRQAVGLRQVDVAARAGLSQSEIARLEAGRGATTSVSTWAVCAAAVGLQLAGFIERAPGTDLPRDLQHLRHQDTVVAAATAGGWHAEPEAALADDGPRPRSIDVLLTREERREAAVVEVWDLLLDGGAAMRGLTAKVRATSERLGEDWSVHGLLVIRGTRRNRRLVAAFASLFAARFPASSDRWLAALRDPDTKLPAGDGLAWTNIEGSRLLAARRRRPRPGSE